MRKAKAAAGGNVETASTSQPPPHPQIQAEASGNNGASRRGTCLLPGPVPAAGHDGAIRSMVDGLAKRLELSPRDADGWTSLMRSRVVLGGPKSRTQRSAKRSRFSRTIQPRRTRSGRPPSTWVSTNLMTAGTPGAYPGKIILIVNGRGPDQAVHVRPALHGYGGDGGIRTLDTP